MATTGDGTNEDAEYEEKMRRLEKILNKFDITIAEANDLVLLQDYEFKIIVDDSGSMRNAAGPNDPRSRWDELTESVIEMVTIANCFDDAGVDIFFLNRAPILGIKRTEDPRFKRTFDELPAGGTPLTETLKKVQARLKGERSTLLFIFTDGEPDGGKSAFCGALRAMLEEKKGKVRVQIMACTHVQREIAWLNDVDYMFTEVDVTDDYESEKVEVIRAGRCTKFTRGDWALKAMLGLVSHKYDQWDEYKKQQHGVCCGSQGSAVCASCAVQ